MLLLFLDGVGIGPPDPGINPFFRVSLPHLSGLLGGTLPTLDRPEASHGDAWAFPLDATLGVPGIPQSGTGQATLLTGGNGARRFGRHFGPWIPVPLREAVREWSVLARVARAGGRVAFANALPQRYLQRALERRPAGPTLAAHGAGVLTRTEEALARGEAVASELTHGLWRRLPGMEWIPRITPERAGGNLARIAGEHDLTLFAHYRTDTEGHRGGTSGAERALVRLDRFIGGLLDGFPEDLLLLVASDHGNLEDLRGGHTLNPALGMVKGPLPDHPVPSSLMDVTPFILSALGLSGKAEGPTPSWDGPAHH